MQYKTNKVQKLCTDLKKATKKLGKDTALSLHSLINFLESATDLQEVNIIGAYHLHALIGNKTGLYALDIAGRKSSYRLIIKPLNNIDKADNLTSFYRSINIIGIEEVSKHYD